MPEFSATDILRDHAGLAAPLTVVARRPLHGGMVNRVEEWITDGDPSAVVAKFTASPAYDRQFGDEFESLRHYTDHTAFPVPRPYALVRNDPRLPGTCLLMEKLPGVNLAEAGLTVRGQDRFQHDLAGIIADLHAHQRDTYGPAWQPAGPARWLECDLFARRMQREFDQVADRLTPGARQTVRRVLDRLDHWLPEAGRPTLVHGDLWATNFLVDDADPDRPRITGFVDGLANYADAEFELAYLLVFGAANRTFFDHYTRRHPLRPGFDRRCRVYWLNTMLIHVRHFGAAYLPRTESIARELEAWE